MDIRLEPMIDDQFDFIVSRDENGLNSGNFLMRRNDTVTRFLAAIWGQTQFLNDKWWEQSAIIHLLHQGYPIRVK